MPVKQTGKIINISKGTGIALVRDANGRINATNIINRTINPKIGKQIIFYPGKTISFTK